MLGLIKLREEKRKPSKEEIYENALQDIMNASTVGEMIRIADRVLKENKR